MVSTVSTALVLAPIVVAFGSQKPKPQAGGLQVTSLTFAPSTVTGGDISTGTVVLSGVAPTSGATVVLASSSSSVAVPSSVNIPSGKSSAQFVVDTFAVTQIAPATITASLGQSTASGALTVDPATLLSISLRPSSVAGGLPSACTLALTGAAPTGSLVVTLSSSDKSAEVPASVTIPAGQRSKQFNVATKPVNAPTSATIAATATTALGLASASEMLTVLPPALTSLEVSPKTVAGGANATGRVTIGGRAQAGGMTVTLATSQTAVTIPASVTIASGESEASFPIKTAAVSLQTSADITASLNGVTESATLTIDAPAFSSFSLSARRVTGGTPVLGKVSLSSEAPINGVTVTLTRYGSAASVPPSVTIQAGQKSATFDVTTNAVIEDSEVSISASLGKSVMEASLAIEPPIISVFTLNPTSVGGGGTSQGSIVLSGSAPSGGAKILLESSSKSASVPVSITIPEGQASAVFTIKTKSVKASATVQIFARYGGSSKSTALNITTAALSLAFR